MSTQITTVEEKPEIDTSNYILTARGILGRGRMIQYAVMNKKTNEEYWAFFSIIKNKWLEGYDSSFATTGLTPDNMITIVHKHWFEHLAPIRVWIKEHFGGVSFDVVLNIFDYYSKMDWDYTSRPDVIYK